DSRYPASSPSGGLASTAANLLHIETGRTRRAQHRNHIDVRNVEAVRQNHHADQARQLSGAEVLDDAIALVVRRLAQDHLAIDAARAQCVAHHGGVGDANAVDEPGAALSEIGGDLIASTLDHAVLDGCGLELVGDKF